MTATTGPPADAVEPLERARRSADWREVRLPVAAPAPVLEPQPGGMIARACRECEVTWYGIDDDDCWCCGETGIDGPLRLFIVRRS